MALLEMTTYLSLLILDSFSPLFDAGYHSTQKFAGIILTFFAWLADMTVVMAMGLFTAPSRGWVHGPGSPLSVRTSCPRQSSLLHRQRMATAWYTDWRGVAAREAPACDE
ncbi:hypothetical protein LZ31DRAFT_594553 [Colletotrichum somersetense]|nr:hypothetical protein LZ31DRAFT_594553 [Colletotrichum somersetense]